MVLSAPPTALWVVPVPELGGVARHVLDVAGHGLPGWRLVVLCPPGPLAEALQALGAAVVVEDVGPAAGLAASVAAVRHTVRALRPAVVHSHLAHADLVAAIALAGDRGPRLVSTEHGIAGEAGVYHASALTARGRELAHHARLRRTDAVVAVSQATAATMRRRWHPRTPITVLRNGIDRPAVIPAGSPGLRVVTLSRLAPEKRLGTVIDAFARLHEGHPEARLTMAGEGPERGPLQRLVHERGLAGVVAMPGHRPAAEVLAEADVLVQLSSWENCSYALLDGLVAGVGVVASDVGGNPEILPAAALVPGDADARAVALAVRGQALQPATRPRLPYGWPDVASTCRGITELYRGPLP